MRALIGDLCPDISALGVAEWLGQCVPLLRCQLRRGARQTLHREHQRFAAGTGFEIERATLEIGLRIDGDARQRVAIRLLGGRQIFGDAARDAGIARRQRQSQPRPDDGFGQAPALHQCVEQRRAGLRQVAPAEPDAARLFKNFEIAVANAALQRITQELGIFANVLCIFGIEGVPLLAVDQQLQPVGAQAVGHRAILDAGEQGLHLFGRRLFQPQAQAPVGDIGFERVVAERLGVALKAHRIADAKGFARGQKIVILCGRRNRRRASQRRDEQGRTQDKRKNTFHDGDFSDFTVKF